VVVAHAGHAVPHPHPAPLFCQGGSTSYGGRGDKADLDNHANQLNPNNPRYGGGGKR
jgi:hypothetical protein